MSFSKSIFLFSLFIFLAVFSVAPKVSALALVEADIAQNTVWTKDQSPYIVGVPVAVLPNATLSIEPGVVVKFGVDSFLLARGAINAAGSESQPIYFTSNYDDETGGNTDDEELCDEECETFDSGDPSAGDWDGIYFKDSSGSNFENVFFRYTENVLKVRDSEVSLKNFSASESNTGIASDGNLILDHVSLKDIDYGDALSFMGGTTVIIDSILENVIDGDAIGVYNGALTVSGLSVKNIGEGSALGIYGGNVVVTDSNFEEGLDEGIEMYGGSLSLFNSLISGYSSGNFVSYRGNSELERLKIENADYGVSVYGGTVALSGSSFKNIFENAAENYSRTTVSAANNFWGDASGPYEATRNPSGLGYPVAGDVLFEPWCVREGCATRNPVIVVPGLFGTEIGKPIENEIQKLWFDFGAIIADIGDEFLDALELKPDLTSTDTSLIIGDVIKKIVVDLNVVDVKVFDYSDGLLKEFEAQGYVEGIDLFLFPYDWRFGVNEDNINKLKQTIADILAASGAEKVDVIAHSTGGLLLKKYAADNSADHRIDKAVFVGVPNTGAPKAIKALVYGDGFGIPFLSEKEMKKIARNLPVAYDLSPSEEYYKDKGSFIKVITHAGLAHYSRDLAFDEVHGFLIGSYNLNAKALNNARNLHTPEFDNYDLRTVGIDLYSVNGCKAGTTGKVVESRYYGPFGGDKYIINSVKVEKVPGDGTVPFESSTNLPIDSEKKYYSLQGAHATMMSSDGIRQQIVNIISESALSTQKGGKDLITRDLSKCELNGKLISIYSPLSIDVTDQDGNHAGLSSDGVTIENNIPNADFDIIGDHKFVYLPTDESQTYTIAIAGTGIGTFTLTDETIAGTNVVQMQVFSDVAVTPSLLGRVNISNETNTTLSLDTDGDGAIDQTLEPTAILDAEQSQDFMIMPREEETEEEADPPAENSESNPTVSSSRSGSRGGFFLPVIPLNNIAVPPIASLPAPSAIAIAPAPLRNIPETTPPEQTTTQTDGVVAQIEVENFPEENALTANVADAGSDAPINKKVVVASLAGVALLLFLAKKFIKL